MISFSKNAFPTICGFRNIRPNLK